MKSFASISITVLLIGSALADVMPLQNPSAASKSKLLNPAQARESTFGSSGWDTTTTYTGPTTYSAPYTPSPSPFGIGFGGGFDIGFPGIINTALTVLLSLIGLTMLVQILSKTIPIFRDLFPKISDSARGLDADTISEISSFALDAIDKMQQMFETPK